MPQCCGKLITAAIGTGNCRSFGTIGKNNCFTLVYPAFYLNLPDILFLKNTLYFLVGLDLYPKIPCFHTQYLGNACCLSAVRIEIAAVFIYRINSKPGKKFHRVFYRKLVQNCLFKAWIFASICIRRHLDIGKITFAVSCSADLFAWFFILFQYGYSGPVFCSCNGCHQPGRPAACNDNTFFLHINSRFLHLF